MGDPLRVSDYQFMVLATMERHGRLRFVPMHGRFSVGPAETRMSVSRATVRSFIRQGLARWSSRGGRGMLDAVITTKGLLALDAQRVGEKRAA